MRLQEKVAILTGAASGIGEAGRATLSGGGRTLRPRRSETGRRRASRGFVDAHAGRAIAVSAGVPRRDDIARIVATAVEALRRRRHPVQQRGALRHASASSTNRGTCSIACSRST
ncbi:L-iditol 2-dehydrogenase [Burkholderia pseudomallei Pakistan 9]|nr:L-iditol 2-dehydrogenase [Burkholderia pseudomallei Pakistan 9]